MGYGLTAHGRANYGHAEGRYEPRFELSSPSDGASGFSIYSTLISFILYTFSSRVSLGTLYIEISENGGGSYNDAYVSGSFVTPYAGSKSRILEYDGQRSKIYIERENIWAFDEEVRVRVTVEEEFGNIATKETPVTWD